MAEFLKESGLNKALEDIFSKAEEQLILVSPYIKLHNRFKDILKRKKDLDKLKITIVFGKNEKNKTKSIDKDDFEFLKEFPNIEIRYEERLHAKYYSNERDSLLSSMNLYDFSQNNNIEFGILTSPSTLARVAGVSVDEQAYNYFNDSVIPNSEALFINEPKYISKMLGITKSFDGFENKLDLLSKEFGVKTKKVDTNKKVDKIAKPEDVKILDNNKTSSVISINKVAEKLEVNKDSVLKLLITEGYIVDKSTPTKKGLEANFTTKKYMGNEYIEFPSNLEVLSKLS